MLYRVWGKFDSSRKQEFRRILTDGTVEGQRPDGKEIVASMRRAVRRGGRVEWWETCYCPTPLEHERATVYDRFFTGLETEEVGRPPALSGDSFWDYLTS